MFSSSVQRGPHVAECDLLRSLAPGLSSLSNGGRFGKDATSLESTSDQGLEEATPSASMGSEAAREEHHAAWLRAGP